MIQRISMIPMCYMIQREFQLEVWTFIIQKSTVIPPSLMVLFALVNNDYCLDSNYDCRPNKMIKASASSDLQF